MVKQFSVIVAVLMFSVAANAEITISGTDAPASTNSLGQPVYIINAATDTGEISSVAISITAADGVLGQVHPNSILTPTQDNNAFFSFVGAEIDQDTQALFNVGSEGILSVGGTDTDSMFDIGLTKFEPFTSRDIMQIVLAPAEEATVVVSVVVAGEQTDNTYVIPEPASLGLLALGSLIAIRRR